VEFSFHFLWFASSLSGFHFCKIHPKDGELFYGKPMQLIDPNHPTYRPLWVRLLIVGASLGWAIVEFTTGDPFWGVLSGGVGAYAFYMLFWTFNPVDPVPQLPVEESPDDEEPPQQS
jgi:hypothetical protein